MAENIGELTDNLPKFCPSKFYNNVKLNIDARDQSRRTENGWYFEYKRDNASSPSANLPEPDGSLKKKVPSKAIELANAEVKKLTENQARCRGPY